MGTSIDYQTNFTRSRTRAAVESRSADGEPATRRLQYVRSWRRAVEARKPRHRRTNRWWW